MENKVKTYKDILQERGNFKVFGVISDITGEMNKVFKSGWVGTQVTVSCNVNGKKQNIKIFGGTGKNTPNVKVFSKDADGNILRDGNNKAISKEIKVSDFNNSTMMSFDKKEVIEWGDRDADGKATKISHISSLTDGDFANQLLSQKDLLIGKRVKIDGQISYKLGGQKKDRIEVDMQIKNITLQKIEEDKEYKDSFVFESPMIINTKSFEEQANKDGVITGYVPIYLKYQEPQNINGVKFKGRNVYTPMTFSVDKHGYLGLPENLDFSIEDRSTILKNRMEAFSQGLELVAGKFLLSNKSGMIERKITFEEILNDPKASILGKKAQSLPEGDEKEAEKEKAIKAYGLMYPLTVKSEFVQKISFINLTQERETGKDIVAGVEPSLIEIKSLDKIVEEMELTNNNKVNTNNSTPSTETSGTPSIKTENTSNVSEPSGAVTGLDFDGDFPF